MQRTESWASSSSRTSWRTPGGNVAFSWHFDGSSPDAVARLTAVRDGRISTGSSKITSICEVDAEMLVKSQRGCMYLAEDLKSARYAMTFSSSVKVFGDTEGAL